MSSNDSSGVKEDGRKPDPGARDDDDDDEDEDEEEMRISYRQMYEADLMTLRRISAAQQEDEERAKSYWPGPENVMQSFYYPFLEFIFSHMSKAFGIKAHLSSDDEPYQWQQLTKWAFGRIGPLYSFRRWDDIDEDSMYTKLKPSIMHAMEVLARQFKEADLPTRLQSLANELWSECQMNEAAVDYVGELIGQDDNTTSMQDAEDDMDVDFDNEMVHKEDDADDNGNKDNTQIPEDADDNEGEEDNTSMHVDADDTSVPQIEPILKASADVVNMMVKGTERYKLAYEFAINECGWDKEELDECLQFLSGWAAEIVDGEDSIEYKQFQSYDYKESKGKCWTYHTTRKRVLEDVNYLIQARKLGGVSVHSVCLEDPTVITITHLPAINDTKVDYLRSEILFELYGVQDVIAHIHDGLVTYHQDAYHALRRNKFPFGYNAATAASNIIYSQGKLSVYPKPIFEAAYPNAGFDDGSIDNLFRGHMCRETIPSKEDIEERIGAQRWNGTVNECAVQNMPHFIECLERNVGKHGVLPGMLLPVEAIIVCPHLFRIFDKLLQEWQYKVVNGDNENQDDGEDFENQDDGQDENENEFEYIDNYKRAMELFRDEDGNLDKVVEKLKEYLNDPEGIMAMIAGKLEGALKEKEPRANAYVSMSIIRATEFHLRKDDRFDVYKSDGFEVAVTSEQSMDDAGVEPLRGTCKYQAKMVCAPTIAERFFIQPGNSKHPISGLTLVVYMDENLKKLDNNSIEVHQIKVDESVFKKETTKPKYKRNPKNTKALKAVLESATRYEDAKNSEAMKEALKAGFSIAFIKAKFKEKQEDHNI